MSLEPKPVDASAKQAADAKASLLLRKSESSYAFPVLDSVGNQFARSLRDLIRALGAATVQVERETTVQMRFADWCQAVSPGLFWRYHAPPLKGPVLLAAARPLLLQLVDIFYGGKGQLAGEREELTDAEERFAARLGRDVGEQLAAAWGEVMGIAPQLDCVTCDSAKLQAVRAEDEQLHEGYVGNRSRGTSARNGALASFSDSVGSAIGQSTPIAASFQRTPASAARS